MPGLTQGKNSKYGIIQDYPNYGLIHILKEKETYCHELAINSLKENSFPLRQNVNMG